MALDEALAVVTFAHVSGLPENNIQNSFAIRGDAGLSTPDTVTAITTAIAGFYNTAQSTTRDIAYYLSHGISRASNATSVKVYDVASSLDGTPHGSPVGEGFFTLDAPASNPDYPDQMACVLTLRAFGWGTALVEAPDGSDPGSLVDRPRQRKSGRLYLGPFNSAASTEPSDGTPNRPVSALITTVLEAADDFGDALDTANLSWCVWSRVDAEFNNVVEAQMDNRWDTQRRRLVDATSRSVIAVV